MIMLLRLWLTPNKTKHKINEEEDKPDKTNYLNIIGMTF